MRILQILPELNVGGVETGTVDLAKYLLQHGHHSVVVSNGGTLVEELERSGSKHYILPVHKKSLWSILKSIKDLKNIIKKEKIDIVHARSRVPGWIAYFACRKTKATYLTTCHGHYSKHLFSRVMAWSKLVIVPSEVIGRHMIDDFGVSSGHIRRIPRSVDLKKFNIKREPKSKQSPFIISMVGRITPLKGHVYFLKAMAKVVRMMPYTQIWIIGDAPKKKEFYKQELEILARRLGISDHVEFMGNRKDIPYLLSKTDVLVLSTVTQEAFGRVILEAQAAGVPVVATKVGGVVEIIDDEKNGLLVLPKDTDSMANAVMRLLKDKELSQRLVVEARKKLESQFTLEHMAERTVAVYEELLNLLSLLVIKISSVGDVILVTASLAALRKKFPKAKIFCLVGKESRKVLQRCPHLDGLIVLDSKHKDQGLWGLLRVSRKLRKYRFDKVIDFQNNRKSHLLSLLSFAKESYGYNNKKFGFVLSHPAKNSSNDLSPVAHQFQILDMLDIPYREDALLDLWPSEEDQKHVQNLFESEWINDTSNIVGINIAASERWETKNWPVEHMASLCELLASKNIRVVITGMEKDQQKVQELLKLTKTKPANFVGKTDVMQLAALIKKCQVYVTPDSAPMHIAAAVQTPFVAFFGPTDSKRHLPPARNFRLIEKKPNCAPCYSSRCRVLTHECMKDINPEEVAQRIMELVKDKAKV